MKFLSDCPSRSISTRQHCQSQFGLVITTARVPRHQSLPAPIIFFVLVMAAGISSDGL